MAKAISSEELQTGLFVAYYPYVDTPRRDKKDPNNKDLWTYDVNAIFDPQSTAVQQLLGIEEQVRRAAFPQIKFEDRDSNQYPILQRSIKNPKTEEIEKYPEQLAGKILFTFRSRNRQGVDNPPALGKYDARTATVIDLQMGCSEFYSGCICVAKVKAYEFNHDGKKGIAFGLNVITKMKDGERFGGGKQAASKALDVSQFDPKDFQDKSLFDKAPSGLPTLPTLPNLGV